MDLLLVIALELQDGDHRIPILRASNLQPLWQTSIAEAASCNLVSSYSTIGLHLPKLL